MSDKKTLKERYAELNKQLEEREKAYTELLNSKNDDFRRSTLYMSMQNEIQFYKDLAKFEKEHHEYKETLSERKRQDIKKIYDDNRRFMEKADAAYWVGMTKSSDIEDLEKQINDLNGRIKAKDQTIGYLKRIIDEQIYAGAKDIPSPDEFVPEERKPGRKKSIDDATKRRVKKLHKDGKSIRIIAEIENISVGSVSAIINNKK